MEPGAFVRALAETAPSAPELERCGFSNEQAREFAKSFVCVKRQRRLRTVSGADQLLELLSVWDLGKVEIGMIRFPEPPTERSGGTCVGCVEADTLVILPGTGEIAVHELATEDHLLWLVAKNGSALLEALLIAARFLAQRTVGTIDFDDCKAARTAAIECAAAAGGDRYLAFYKMLLGAD